MTFSHSVAENSSLLGHDTALLGKFFPPNPSTWTRLSGRQLTLSSIHPITWRLVWLALSLAGPVTLRHSPRQCRSLEDGEVSYGFFFFSGEATPPMFSIINTFLLTPWSRVFLEKLTGSAASQEIPRIFVTWRFITVLTSARHLSLSWANSIQSSQPPPTSWRFILILSSHLRLGLPNGLFPSGFPTRTLCRLLPSPIRATCPAHIILVDFTTHTILGKEYRSLSSSLYNFFHSSVTSSLLGPFTLLSTICSNTLSLLSSRLKFNVE